MKAARSIAARRIAARSIAARSIAARSIAARSIAARSTAVDFCILDQEGTIVVTHAIKVVQYLTRTHGKGLGIRSQPEPQHYFDRPLNVLFNAAFRAGFMMDGFEEVGFPAGSEVKNPFAWENYPETPPVLGVRLRPSP
jgi:hypothetical protein